MTTQLDRLMRLKQSSPRRGLFGSDPMKITKITQQKQKDRYNVYADDTFIVGLSADTLLKAGWAVGDEISETDVARYRDNDESSKVLTKAYDYLARRPHGTDELRRKLLAKEYTPAAIDYAIGRLTELHYLDDAEFVRLWVRERGVSRGKYALQQELSRKGIPAEIIDVVLSEELERTDSRAQVRELANKRYERMRQEPWDKVYGRLGGYLARRGFAMDDIRPVLEELKKNHHKTTS